MTCSIRHPRSRLAVVPFIAALFFTTVACAPDVSDIDIEGRPPPQTAQVRALVLADESDLDAWFSVPGELPVAFNGIDSPGVTEWRSHPIGEATAILSRHGSTLASEVTSLAEGGRYTAVHFGKADSFTSMWIEEQEVEVPEGHVLIRVLHGAPGKKVLDVSLGLYSRIATTQDEADDGSAFPPKPVLFDLVGEMTSGTVSADVAVDVRGFLDDGASEGPLSVEGHFFINVGDPSLPLMFSGLLKPNNRYTLAIGSGADLTYASFLLVNEDDSSGVAGRDQMPVSGE